MTTTATTTAAPATATATSSRHRGTTASGNGSPYPAGWLEVFETDSPEPLFAYPRVASPTPAAPQIQPQLSQSFRLAATRKTNGA